MLYASDLITQYFPWYFMVSQHLKSFSIPHFVNGLYGSGYPLLAQGETGILSPINAFILFFLPFFVAVIVLYLAYALIAFVGTFLFLKTIRVSTLASTFGSLVFLLSGFMVSRYFQPSIIFTSALFPFGMYLIMKSKTDKRFLFAFAPLIYLQVTAGHLQMAMISASAYILFSALQIFLDKKSITFFIKFLVVIVLGFLLSAIQLVPSFKLFKLSQRGNWDPNIRYSYSLPPQHLITYIKPYAYGLSKPGDDLNFRQFGGGFWELNMTIWTLPFIFSLIPLLYVLKRENNQVIILYSLWLIFILFCFGGFFKPNRIVSLISDFPFRASARFLLVTTFVASALSAIGFEYIMKNLSKQLKLAVFFLVLASIFYQQMLLYRTYFIIKNPKEINSDLINKKTELTTPLELDWNNPKLDAKSFKNEFYKGLIISLFSLLAIYTWYLRETKTKKQAEN